MKKVVFSLFLGLCSLLSFAQTTTNYGVDSGNQGVYNSFFGYESGKVNTESRNTFIGYSSGKNNTTGQYNTFLGSSSGIKNITGSYNVFLGAGTGSNNTTGENNVFAGHFSGISNTTGHRNVFIGFYSGRKNTIGNNNSFYGNYSGYDNTTGTYNVFTGSYTGHTNTTGANNVFTGAYSGKYNLSGNDNAFFGNRAGYSNISGTQNTYIGNISGYASTGSRNVFIGYKSGRNEIGDDKLYIDNSDTSTPLLYGDFATNQLGINTNTIPMDYAFAVKGKIISEEITVKVYPWSDFVFEDGYNLPTLEDVENHINEKGHLKDIPTAKEVSENGVNVGEMEAKLLQKIEELTLYTIHQEKEIKNQKEINKNLEERLLKLENLIKQLSKN